MKRYVLRALLVWVFFGAAVFAAIRYGLPELGSLRDGGCLQEYSLSSPKSIKIPPEVKEWILVYSKGKMYAQAESGVYELCATGDPARPTITFEEMK